MRKVVSIAFFLFASVATACNPFLPMDNRPFTDPKHPEWVYNPAGERSVQLGIGWLTPISPLEPNLVRGPDGNPYLIVCPIDASQAGGETGWYWVR